MAKKQTFDFSGWATRNDVKCSDGRIIRKNAFKHCDGQEVPLVWNHNHGALDNVLGHALLENREQGVYAYCSFNATAQGQTAKELVKHGDIGSLSIYANQLKQNGSEVMHGTIREVSLVLAGANPLAKIEDVMAHADGEEFEATISLAPQTFNFDATKTEDVVSHSDEDEDDNEDIQHKDADKTVQEVFDSFTEEQKTVVYALIGAAVEEAKGNKVAAHSAMDDEDDDDEFEHAEGDKTIKEVFDSFTEEQKTVVYALIGAAVEAAKKGSDKKKENQEDNKEMKQNAFDATFNDQGAAVLTHSDILATIESAKKTGSMREAFEGLCLQHSITNIGELFPDWKAVKGPATKDDSNNTWVQKVMGKVHHSPFSRIKSSYFDITGDDARARGYIKGNQKVEEVIAAFKRTTSPQTVYKLQKLDRDDIIDITDFDVVAYIKAEMRLKLDREIARAILIGDGRPGSSNDKINPLNIRPIVGDDPIYTVYRTMTKSVDEQAEVTATGMATKFAKRFIKQAIKARKDYKGSGNLVLYTSEDMLTDMLLIEDRNERVIYDTVEKLKTALMVTDIVTIPDFANATRTVSDKTLKIMGIFVNLVDYNIGADKGGAVNMFDDFDINFNKYEYLIETRCSGALIEPYSAIAFEEEVNFQQASQ